MFYSQYFQFFDPAPAALQDRELAVHKVSATLPNRQLPTNIVTAS